MKFEEKAVIDDQFYIDKNTPQKIFKRTNPAEDAVNPYVNQNLDADLSTTIGKNKANRKQINTD